MVAYSIIAETFRKQIKNKIHIDTITANQMGIAVGLGLIGFVIAAKVLAGGIMFSIDVFDIST